MSGRADRAATVVAVANGRYARLRALPRAVPDTERLVQVLREKHGYDGTVIADRLCDAVVQEVREALPDKSLIDGALIVVWTGHGTVGADRTLRLLGPASDSADDEVMDAKRLAERAARTGARQILLILDTCHSGAAAPEAVAIADAVLAGRADLSQVWFGVLTSARSDQDSLSGALAGELIRLLDEGPRSDEWILRWNLAPRIRGSDVAEALRAEWAEDRHQTWLSTAGSPAYMLNNPRRGERTGQVVEHLLTAARGTSTEANFFTGREEVLTEIVGWLKGGVPGLCVVTGPPGSGKSGILGRLVSLSVSGERNRIAPMPPAAQDPGASSIAAHAHLRGMTWTAVADGLADQVEAQQGGGVFDLLAEARRRRQRGTPLVVVLDGLDEAGDVEAREIAVQVIEPLAKDALVVVGSRDIVGTPGEPPLLSLLGRSGLTVDLGLDAERALRDVHRYAVARTTGISPSMDPGAVGDEIVAIARADAQPTDGLFLLARLITSQLRGTPVDTSSPDWRAELAGSVEAALEADLEHTVLTVGGHEHPTAARELLRALSCALGRGMPADDIWPAMATAMSPSGTRYTKDDAYALLMRLGRHVVADVLGDQPVYRIAHQRLIDFLYPAVRNDPGLGLSPTVAVAIASAAGSEYRALLDAGGDPDEHDYLWQFFWRHCGDAGADGIALLREFVERDPDTFQLDLALALSLVGSRAWIANEPDRSVEYFAEAVELRRHLDDPLALSAALFELSYAQATTGNTAAADEAAQEASTIARQSTDQPEGKLTLARTLMARASTQLHQGRAIAAQRMATEAIELVDAVTDDADQAVTIAGACTVAAGAALGVGDLESADALSLRAVAELGRTFGDRSDDMVILSALSTRAWVELSLLVAGADIELDSDGLPDSATRIVRHYREVGATQNTSDVLVADGLRLYAITVAALRQRGDADHDDGSADLMTLLDEAEGLVAPFRERSAAAGLVNALVLMARATVFPGDHSERDMAAAGELLDSQAAGNPLAARLLVEVLHTQVRLDLRDGIAPAELVERQREVVSALVGAGEFAGARPQLINALELLWHLLAVSGQLDQAGIPVVATLVDQLRELDDDSAATGLRIARALADLSGLYGPTRPAEASDAAREGLALIEQFDAAPDRMRAIRGQLQMNLSVAQLVLGEVADAIATIDAAIVDLTAAVTDAGDAGAPPVLVDILGMAHINRAQIRLSNGDVTGTAEDARAAIPILSRPESRVDPTMLAVAHVCLGHAVNASGRPGNGDAEIADGIGALRANVADDGLSIGRFAAALNIVGPELWESVLAEFADQPDLGNLLVVLRERPTDEADLAVADLREALAHFAGDPDRLRQVKEVARSSRKRLGAAFDAAWTGAAGSVPDWLAVEWSLSHQVIAWWNTPTLETSRDYLAIHRQLLSAETDILLRELATEESDEPLLAFHLRIREAAARSGITEAYAPDFARGLLSAWIEAPDDDEFELLAAHEEALLSDDVLAALEDLARQGDDEAELALRLRSILELTRRGELAVATRIAREPGFGLTLVRDALRSADPARLDAICALCLSDDESVTDEQAHLLATARAVALACVDASDEAREVIASVADVVPPGEAREPLRAAVLDALARHADRQHALLPLLEALA